MKILYKHIMLALCMTAIGIPKCLRRFIYTYTNKDIVYHNLAKQYFKQQLVHYFPIGIECNIEIPVFLIPPIIKDYVLYYSIQSLDYMVITDDLENGYGEYIVPKHKNCVIEKCEYNKFSIKTLIDECINNIIKYPKSKFVLQNMVNLMNYIYNDNGKTNKHNFNRTKYEINNINAVANFIEELKCAALSNGISINLPKIYKQLPYDIVMQLVSI